MLCSKPLLITGYGWKIPFYRASDSDDGRSIYGFIFNRTGSVAPHKESIAGHMTFLITRLSYRMDKYQQFPW